MKKFLKFSLVGRIALIIALLIVWGSLSAVYFNLTSNTPNLAQTNLIIVILGGSTSAFLYIAFAIALSMPLSLILYNELKRKNSKKHIFAGIGIFILNLIFIVAVVVCFASYNALLVQNNFNSNSLDIRSQSALYAGVFFLSFLSISSLFIMLFRLISKWATEKMILKLIIENDKTSNQEKIKLRNKKLKISRFFQWIILILIVFSICLIVTWGIISAISLSIIESLIMNDSGVPNDERHLLVILGSAYSALFFIAFAFIMNIPLLLIIVNDINIKTNTKYFILVFIFFTITTVLSIGIIASYVVFDIFADAVGNFNPTITDFRILASGYSGVFLTSFTGSLVAVILTLRLILSTWNFKSKTPLIDNLKYTELSIIVKNKGKTERKFTVSL